MNKPTKTTATNIATSSNFHKLASYVGTGARAVGTLAKAFGKNLVSQDDYTKSLKAQGYGKK